MKKNYTKPVKPEMVYSPKGKVSEVEVLLDRGEGGFSIVSLKWDNEPRIGIRWNGDGESIGQPQSCGYPTWFILPREIALSYADSIGDIKMKAVIEISK